MYKIMIYIDTHSGDKWFYYQENEKDYVAYSLHEIKDTVLTLIDTYGKDNIKIVKQVTGEDMEGSVETFIYDSTDNYEELLNRPSINGVEVIGQLSLDDLGIQPAGDYATNEKVGQVEAKVDAIDLEPYATMDYLDEVVAGIDFSASNENITGVKTFSVLPRSTVAPTLEDELTNKSYVDHGVENCASKDYVAQYVEDSIANIEIPEVIDNPLDNYKILKISCNPLTVSTSYLSITATQEMKDFITEWWPTKDNKFLVDFGGIMLMPTKVKNGNATYGQTLDIFLTPYFIPGSGNMNGNTSDASLIMPYIYFGQINFTDGVCTTLADCRIRIQKTAAYATVSSLSSYAKNTDVLTKTNTTEFTPDADYEPATKKYVDDSVAAIDIPTGSSNVIEQVETLPSGSEELVGTVYQYIGATNTSYGYIHGNYYICTKKMYLNKHNDRKTSYPWVNAQYENIIKEIPMHEYRNTRDVHFLTPGEHQVWGGTTFDVASDLSKILKRYTSDYDSCLFLYSERLIDDTQEYVSVLFTVSYNTTIDNVQYQVLEGITHSIKNPGKTAHVVLRTAINGFNDYSCSPVFIVTEQSGANLDNYYTKEEVDAAIAAAITGALEGEY